MPPECPICLDALRDPVQLPCCGHGFCRACIALWLRESSTCPLDRSPLGEKELSGEACACPHEEERLCTNSYVHKT